MWHGIKCNGTFTLHNCMANIAFHGYGCIGCKLTLCMALMVRTREIDNFQESRAVYWRLSNAFELKRFIEDYPMLLK